MNGIAWLIHAFPEPALIHNEAKLILANEQFVSLSGLTGPKPAEFNLLDWLSKAIKSREASDQLKKTFGEGTTATLDIEAKIKGTLRHFTVATQPVPFEWFNSSGHITFFQDRSGPQAKKAYWDLHVRMSHATTELESEVAERRRAESELRAAQEKLSAANQDLQLKTKLLEDSLAAQKMAEAMRVERDAAEKANRAKSLFLANISHELRTPMHGILSYAHFGQKKFETAPKEKLKSYFDEIHDSASRLMALLNDLLDLSKLEAGKVEYAMAVSDLGEVATTAVAELEAFARDKGLKCTIQKNSPDVKAACDAPKILQVVRNLLSNAIKFSTKGTLINVALERNDGEIVCSVVNQGVGIPKSELESVFDKFVQSSKTRTGAGGTGLGLAISKEIILHHGGRIWAESDPNGETKFAFTLPRTK